MKTMSRFACARLAGMPEAGTDDDGDGPAGDGFAFRWLGFQTCPKRLPCTAHGRIYDAAWKSPYWYHFPSLNVNAAGDLLVGFSGSRATEYIGAFCRGRRANGTWMSRPVLVQAGRCPFNEDRWGDYSATTIDPGDGSLWTIQEYADPTPFWGFPWGTWIGQVKPAP